MLLPELTATHIDLKQILSLAVKDNVLPQGTPASPVITNICMVPIDQHITNLLNKYGDFIYTRYADDLLISSKHRFNPTKIISIVNEAIKNTPLSLNNAKTRFGARQGKNWNLGLMLNQENNITLGHYKKERFRASLNNALQGIQSSEAQKLLGMISYFLAIEREWTNKVLQRIKEKKNIDMLQFLKNQTKI